MRILIITNLFGKFGGAESFMYNEANLLRDKGHEVFFFASDKKPYFEENYEFAAFFPKYIDYKTLTKFNSLKYIFRSIYNREAELKLDKFLKEIKPDFVRCHNIHYHLTPSVFNACKKNNIPVIMTLHDPRLMCPSGTLMFKNESYCKNELCISGNPIYCSINKCKYGSFRASLLASLEYLLNRLFRLHDNVRFFICPSQAVFDLALRSGINREKLAYIPHFMPDSYFINQPEYTNKGYFLYVGRLSKEKGLHYLLEAMSQLPEIKLHVVGTGPEKENLENEARNLNLSNVVFLGFKEGQELEQEYKDCIATILPCNWFEAFGLTVVESFIHGKPVIGSNIGGIQGIIDNELNGIRFEPGNIDELAESIKKLHYDTDLVVSMGKNARSKAENLYNSKIYYEKLIELCNSLTSKKA